MEVSTPMKRFCLFLALTLFAAGVPARADWTFSVSPTITAITAQQKGPFSVIIRENSGSPTAIFTIWPGPTSPAAGAAGTITAAGGVYQFLYPGGAPVKSGQVLGYIKSSTSGPFTFVAITSNATVGAATPFIGDSGNGGRQGLVPAPAAGDAAAGKVLGAGGGWVVPAGGGGGPAAWSALTAPTGDLSLDMATHASTFQDSGLWRLQIPTLGTTLPSSPVFALDNPTPGTVDSGQNSPALEFRSHGWDGAASTNSLYRIFGDGSTGISTDLQFYGSVDGGSTWNQIGEMYGDGTGADWGGNWDFHTISVDSCTGCGGVPGGADTQVQFKDGSSFDGNSGFTYDKNTDSAALLGDLSLFNLTINGTCTGCPTTPPGGADTQVQFNDAGTANGDQWFTWDKNTSTASIFNLTIAGTCTGCPLFNPKADTNPNDNNGYGANVFNALSSGAQNVALGTSALNSVSDGSGNTAVGRASLMADISGGGNVAEGTGALSQTTADTNTGIGANAGAANQSGSDNSFLGSGADAGSGALNNATAIGAGAIVGNSNTVQLGNTSVTKVNTKTAYAVDGTTGITDSGTACTITAIKGGIITGASCT